MHPSVFAKYYKILENEYYEKLLVYSEYLCYYE